MRVEEFGRVLGERDGLTNVLLTTLAFVVVVLDREGNENRRRKI